MHNRLAVIALVVMSAVVFACGGSSPTGDTGSDAGRPGADAGTQADAGVSSLELAVPPRVVAPGEDAWECLYTTLDAGRAAGIKQWQSTASAGIVELVVFFTDTATEPDGTVKACGYPADLPRVLYWASSESDALSLPDGVGMSLA